MNGLHTIYINGEEGYSCPSLLHEAPCVNIEPLAASMLLPTTTMFVD